MISAIIINKLLRSDGRKFARRLKRPGVARNNCCLLNLLIDNSSGLGLCGDSCNEIGAAAS